MTTGAVRTVWGWRCPATSTVKSGQVRYSPFLGWRDVPLAGLLEDATGLTTTLENDVKALTVAEQWFGDGVGASSFAMVTVGAGIGSALVVGGA